VYQLPFALTTIASCGIIGVIDTTVSGLDYYLKDTPVLYKLYLLKLTMNRKVIRTDFAPAPVGPYNQAITASGQMVFVAGQIALDPSTSKIVGEKDVAKQTEQVIVNIKAVLEAGSRIQDVVKTTVFLADMNDLPP